ncbi:MAG: hypothetical protein GX256_05695 [Fretibacterium sp.]|nr:hypothetical protein [Fretibacterium sp.]
MSRVDVRQQLLERNPFLSSASPEPWDNNFPDLTGLNKDVGDHIFTLLRGTREGMRGTMAGLVLGEAGSGKTHMLKRVLDSMQEMGEGALFASIRAFLNPTSVFQDLRRGIFVNLKRKRREHRSQIDFLGEAVKARFHQDLVEGRVPSYYQDSLQLWFQEEYPDVDPRFLRLFYTYMDVKDSRLLGVMQGDISDDDFPGNPDLKIDDFESRDAAQEAEAQRAVLSLGMLLDYAKMPLIICFDQLDAMSDEGLIQAWGRVSAELINNVYGVLPLAFLRSDKWNAFSAVLDNAVKDRYQNNLMVLRSCTLEESWQLLEGRLRLYYEDDYEEKMEWLRTQLEAKLAVGDYAPRHVIEMANRAILQPLHPVRRPGPEDDREEILRAFAGVWSEERDKVAAEPGLWPPNLDDLSCALELWLTARSDCSSVVRTGQRFRVLEAECLQGAERVLCSFAFCATRHNSPARAALNAGLKFLNEDPMGRICYYVTEASVLPALPQWPKVHELLSEFRNQGGRVVVLDEETRVCWYALLALRNRIEAGDVRLYLSEESRLAVREDLMLFLRERFEGELLPFEGGKVEPPPLTDLPVDPFLTEDWPRLHEAICSLLTQAPMRMMKADFLLERLRNQDFKILHAGLLAYVKGQEECFRLWPCENGSLIQMV